MAEREGFGAGSVLMAFFLGGIVGAAVSLLLAPESGRETRRKIKETAEDVQERVTGTVEKGKKKVSEIVEKGKELVDEKKSVITSAIEAGKEAFKREKEKEAGA